MRPDYIERERVNGGGVYAFFVFDSFDSKGKAIFKIGMTTSFHNRIAGYHTYLPAGLYYKALLENPSIHRDGLNLNKYYMKIEKEIFQDIKMHGGEVIKMKIRKNNLGETEWIYTNEKLIDDAFGRAYDKYRGKNTHLHLIDNLNSKLKKKLEYLKENAQFRGEMFF